MPRGKFIVIEGTEMVGKTTQCEMLKRRMEELGIPVYATTEPSNGPAGFQIRHEYLSGNRIAHKKVIDYLYLADRLDHVSNTTDGILTYLDQGINVITDRYYMSSLVFWPLEYYGTDRYEYELNYIWELHRPIWELLRSDLTIMIDCPFDVSIQRMKERPGKIEIYDNTDIIQKTTACYTRVFDFLRSKYESILKVDGVPDIHKVHEDIWNEVSRIIK